MLPDVAQDAILVGAAQRNPLLPQLLDRAVPLGAGGPGAQRVGQQLEERVGLNACGSGHRAA